MGNTHKSYGTTSAKKKPETDWESAKLVAEQMYRDAIRNGTHSEKPRLTVCDGCREWVDAILYVTTDHKRICRTCDPTRKAI